MTASPNPPPDSARPPRLWALSLSTLGIVLAAHLGSSLLWRSRLPDPVATHWGGSGVADGTGSLATHVLVGAFTLVLLGILMPVSAGSLAGAAGRSGVPLMAGLGNSLVVGIGGMFLSGLVGQLDAAAALGTRMDGAVLVAGIVLAVLWGIGSALLVRAALPPRVLAEGPASPGTASAAHAFAPGTVIASTVRGPVWMLALMPFLAVAMAVLGLTAGRDSPAAFWSMVPGLAIVLGAGATCLAGKVVADDAGIRVYGGGFLKLLHVKPADVEHAEAREIAPAEFGGWGLRVSGAGIAFIMGAGPGVVVHRPRGGARIYSVASMADARAMAGLLNSRAAGQHRAGSST
jgi:hypothetical protein